jgi:hypothetical protein
MSVSQVRRQSPGPMSKPDAQARFLLTKTLACASGLDGRACAADLEKPFENKTERGYP